MGRNRKLSMEDCITIRTRYEAKEPVRDIARDFGVAALTIMRGVLKAGGEIPHGPTYDGVRDKLTRHSGPARTVDSYLAGGYRRVVIDDTDPLFCMGSLRGRPEHCGTRTVLEHRLVLARKLGRPLLAHETVHHKDGNRLNNHSDNLELRVGQHGKGATHAHCVTCRCFDGTE